MLTSAAGRLSQLKELRDKLAEAIDYCESMRDLAALSKQYRETIAEIDGIEGGTVGTDEIAEILTQRQSDGRAGTVRKNKTKV